MSVARFDARKMLIEEEVNAINTTNLRVQLLSPPLRKELTAQRNAPPEIRFQGLRAHFAPHRSVVE